MGRIKVGQIGVGHLGTMHCSALMDLAEVDLQGVFDLDFEKSRSVASKFKVKSYATLDALLSQVQAVIVAVPTRSHHEVVKKALANNVHVFVEKPITAEVEEAEELIRIADDRKSILQVGHIERFNPALAALNREALHPRFIEARRLATFNKRGTDVAVVLDLMIHDLDIILNLVDSSVASFEASGVAVVSSEIDIANARIQFKNGCVANVTASRISQKRIRGMRLFQKDAYISLDFMNRSAGIYRLCKKPVASPNHRTVLLGSFKRNGVENYIAYEDLEVPSVDPLKSELSAFLQCVRSGASPPVDGVAGKRVLQLAIDITRTIEKQNT
ncbi:MAG: Gfo/Idh/MocA family protein [bacterium]